MKKTYYFIALALTVICMFGGCGNSSSIPGTVSPVVSPDNSGGSGTGAAGGGAGVAGGAEPAATQAASKPAVTVQPTVEPTATQAPTKQPTPTAAPTAVENKTDIAHCPIFFEERRNDRYNDTGYAFYYFDMSTGKMNEFFEFNRYQMWPYEKWGNEPRPFISTYLIELLRSELHYKSDTSPNSIEFSWMAEMLFDKEITKIAVEWQTSARSNHVGWADFDGNITDVTEKIYGNANGFSKLPQNTSPLFGPDGLFYFFDKNAEKVRSYNLETEEVKDYDVKRNWTSIYNIFQFFYQDSWSTDYLYEGMKGRVCFYNSSNDHYVYLAYEDGSTEILTPETDYSINNAVSSEGKILFSAVRGDDYKVFQLDYANGNYDPQEVYAKKRNTVCPALLFWKDPDIDSAYAQKITSGLENAVPGDIVKFGSYEQDADTSNGAEPIEWYVLDKQGRKVLLLSKNILDALPYNAWEANASWEACSLRNWLNGYFYRSSFNTTEKNYVSLTALDNPDNPHFGTKGGGTTNDMVFLLSLEEIRKYFHFGADEGDFWFQCDDAKINACASRTAYENYMFLYDLNTDTSHCKYNDEAYSPTATAWWWLRTPGYSLNMPAVVNYDGCVALGADFLDISYNGGVRPAIWIDLNP